MTSLPRRRMRARRARKGAPIILVLVLVLAGLASLAAATGAGAVFAVYQNYAKDYVPIEERLLQKNIGLTEIYDRGGPIDGVLLGKLTNPDAQLLAPVPLAQISPYLVAATVSTEDNSFWENPGINIRGLFRAAIENYVLNEFGAGTGGSSITQQLIKNVYICPNVGDESERCQVAERTLDRKLREIAYAIELDQDYSKEQILGWYLNQISYADRYIGIQAASQGYFGKNASDLTLAEAALLAGVPQAPTAYHPRLNCVRDANQQCVLDELGRSTIAETAKERQEAVLDLMVVHNRATAEEVAAAKLEPVKVYAASNPLKASAFIDNQVEPRLVRMCEAGVIPKLPGAVDCVSSVHNGGYKVTTTLNWELTDIAQQTISSFIEAGLQNGCQCHNGAIVTIQPDTGEVIVYAPNRDPSLTSDRRVAGDIDQLNEINQPGSSFKPAVYLAWFEYANKAPMSTFWDTSPLAIEGTEIVNPRRDEIKSEGMISARAALGGSQNIGAFRAAQEAGVDNVIEIGKKLGITTLDQRFDPTFRAHSDVTYGASIATGGANIRAIDMAYMDATIANMGVLVGVPHYARYVPLRELRSTAIDSGGEYERALAQREDFSRGHIRIPGTRELDPVVILEVIDKSGNSVFKHSKEQLVRKQVVDAGSVWLLHSIMEDCRARYIIWSCGGSNNDLALDFFDADGSKVPAGVKTGTQQGPLSAADTLETWVTGYSRYAATAVWVGNATNELVQDRSYAAANTTVRLYKNWMGIYHTDLKRKGVYDSPSGFSSLRPKNVAEQEFPTTAMGGGLKGGCDQKVTAWVRTDITYESECEEKEIDTRNGLLASELTPAQFKAPRKFVKLPDFKKDIALELAQKLKIPIAPTDKSTGQVAVSITSPTAGRLLTFDTPVVGSVGTGQLESWTLEIGLGSNPSQWTTIGSGTTNVRDSQLGLVRLSDLYNSIYTIRLTAKDTVLGDLVTFVQVNARGTFSGEPPRTPTPTPNP